MARALLAMLAVAALGVTGCSIGNDAAPVHGAELVASWSQVDFDYELLVPIAGTSPRDARLVVTDAAREAMIASVAPELDAPPGTVAAIEAVDLGASLIVVGAYPRCTETGQVSTDGEQLWFEAMEPDSGTLTACYWSPLQVEVWRVPLDALGDGPPLELTPPT